MPKIIIKNNFAFSDEAKQTLPRIGEWRAMHMSNKTEQQQQQQQQRQSRRTETSGTTTTSGTRASSKATVRPNDQKGNSSEGIKTFSNGSQVSDSQYNLTIQIFSKMFDSFEDHRSQRSTLRRGFK